MIFDIDYGEAVRGHLDEAVRIHLGEALRGRLGEELRIHLGWALRGRLSEELRILCLNKLSHVYYYR